MSNGQDKPELPYERHFDGFEEPEDAAVGCKYCSCHTFKEATNGSSTN